MDPTTLVTFLFRAPPAVHTVELLGSWDNFRRPYRMHHDRLRGATFYTGCFKFENIIFDGGERGGGLPRTGGLKQGGTYWYYYRLNYDCDAYDHGQPHTTACPIMPGQPLNVIEVPTEIIDIPTRCQSAYGSDMMRTSLVHTTAQTTTAATTLDPAERYAPVEAPPKSKVHSRCLSDDQLAGRLEGIDRPLSAPPATASRQVRPVSPFSRRSLHSLRVPSARSVVSSIYSQRSPRGTPGTGIDSELPDSEEAMDAMNQVDHPMDTRSLASSSHRRQSTLTCGSASIHNVHSYTISDGNHHVYQPQVYSPSPSHSSDDSPVPSPFALEFPMLPKHEYLDCIPDFGEHPDTLSDGLAALELSSPTFTATTVSSTGGNNTPFRLSARLSCEESLLKEGVPNTTSSRNHHHPSWELHYSLPNISSDSNHSLAKTITSTRTTTTTTKISLREERPSSLSSSSPPLPSIIQEEEGSMMDAIFSELKCL
ncbi:uncharacterized protein SEPMUDRAFT_146915 [Sphaerulina musiva SO2202]|uniref:Uncharacterized protein n=1 Tax=Sphaerulina musiva (strain SO2202) TaxID=692275 RepID=M3DAJ8_SPHMS|nr:uncharacterized protein SEPMUDRAFT_146915 [Sphaerulina musiva SO2202]EMF14884.1 hypothetical protein SEPMUDRAFT_146915 [Sphaerulina musiva SO2202]